MSVTGAQVRTMLEEIVHKVVNEWTERFGRVQERQSQQYRELVELRARVQHLEKLVKRIGTVALQERL